MLAQVAGIALDGVTMGSVVAAIGSNQQPIAIDRARIDRQIRGRRWSARAVVSATRHT